MTTSLAFITTPKSSNTKTGPIPVTTSPRATCPDTCPLKGKAGGCYAEGSHMGVMWSKLDETTPGKSFSHGRAQVNTRPWEGLIDFVHSIAPGSLWRMNQAGDLPHNKGKLDGPKVRQLIKANKGKNGFTYTHHHARTKHNQHIIQTANKGGFTVNLSANNLSHADELAALAIAPVVTLLPESSPKTTRTPQGRKVITCPATYRDDVTCKTCGICADNRPGRAIIGFPVHGAGKRKAAKAAQVTP